jgi:hypothetical protein
VIRDPSDGTIRTPDPEASGAAVDLAPAKPIFDTGLPAASQKPKNIERLEASRTWLKSYHAKKGSITNGNV